MCGNLQVPPGTFFPEEHREVVLGACDRYFDAVCQQVRSFYCHSHDPCNCLRFAALACRRPCSFSCGGEEE